MCSWGAQVQVPLPLVRFGAGLGLSPQDIQFVIAFLHTLTDTSYVNNPDLSNPFGNP
ncbi:MAG: hypothetical protein VX310_00015 [Gemmatimonadota bacterium]|nr:hypothetical protein [Gemmatimonadota bacterium]